MILVFFAIHAGRLQADWTWLGLISPLVAVVGDVLSASARRGASASPLALPAAAYAAHRTARMGTPPLGSDRGESTWVLVSES